MKKIDLPLILDVLFYAVCTFFISVGILRFYRVPTAVTFGVAILFSIATGTGSFLLIYSKHRRRNLTKAERERKEKLMLHLTLETSEKRNELIALAYAADGQNTLWTSDGIAVDGKLCIPRFTMQPLSADEIAKLLQQYGESPFCLLANTLSPEAQKLLDSFAKQYVLSDEIFALFERTHTIPEKMICGNLTRPKLKAKLRRTFHKRNARPFFVSGSLLLIMSLFTMFPLYYLISGCALLFTAVGVRILGFS